MELTDRERAAFRRDRITRITEDGLIRLQPCPTCGALIGQDCHSRESWYPTTPHAARKRLAGL